MLFDDNTARLCDRLTTLCQSFRLCPNRLKLPRLTMPLSKKIPDMTDCIDDLRAQKCFKAVAPVPTPTKEVIVTWITHPV